MNKYSNIFSALNELNIDCLLITDFKGRDPFARKIVGLREEKVFSRRWYLLFHKSGTLSTVCHSIEGDALNELPLSEFQTSKFYYSSRLDLQSALSSALHSSQTVALCYSPGGEIPIISTVDAGTVELIRSLPVTVVSAAEVLQSSFSKLSEGSYKNHVEAAKLVDQIRNDAFLFIQKHAGQITEYDAVNYILSRFEDEKLMTDHVPCVAVNENSASPHYEPSKNRSRVIKAGDFVLIDLWAKEKKPNAIYYDITWVGVLRDKPSKEEEKIFSVVRAARDGVVDFIKGRVSAGEAVYGYEADRVARNIIAEAGYERNFLHRTGHSITESVHGEGANLDDFETKDTRRLIPWSCFSVEPGIYLNNFGIRSEVNMFMLSDSVEVSGEVQKEILCLG